MPNHYRVYGSVRLAVDPLIGPGEFPDRLGAAVGFLLPLLLEDSPADELGRHFSDVRQALTREEPPMTVEDQCSAAGRIVDLFEAVCRMDAGAR